MAPSTKPFLIGPIIPLDDSILQRLREDLAELVTLHFTEIKF